MRFGDPIGVIVGESSPYYSIVLFDSEIHPKPRVGMYVVAETEEGTVLGVVENIRAGNPLIPGDLNSVTDVIRLSEYRDLLDKKYLRGSVQWLSLLDHLEEGNIRSPTIPPIPSARVYRAPRESLQKIFAPSGENWLEIGRLLSDESVTFRIDVDQLARHLAILAVTGGGKSNTVCILSTRLVQNIGATVVIFDMHGEYVGMDLPPTILNIQSPKINPINLKFDELRKLARLPENAHNQERVLREAWNKAMEEFFGSKKVTSREILNALKSNVEKISKEEDASTRQSAKGVLNRLDDLETLYGDILSGSAPISLTEYIIPGKLNVIDLSSVDERAADAVVAHYLRRLLMERKDYLRTDKEKGYPVPVIAFIEEAHILIPEGGTSLTKYWASRIAREGRKFQIGIALVSQRPKNIDSEVLSQTNNKIILRIVEPTDLNYVQKSTEQMSDDIRELLPGLNPGEAVIVGMMTRLPAIVKIDLCNVKRKGRDISLVSMWKAYNKILGNLDDSEYF